MEDKNLNQRIKPNRTELTDRRTEPTDEARQPIPDDRQVGGIVSLHISISSYLYAYLLPPHLDAYLFAHLRPVASV